ncbi:MAG: nitrile hydratase subunit alpha [Alphaproteobacteria bacterium]|nr:nitrile hydratase subunit alpha [Alphaproteobacteria bacterium]
MSSPDEHVHEHDHDHDHDRTFQPDIEDSPYSHYQVMAQALGEILIDKGIITADELREQIEAQDSRNPAEGAKLIARAWTDPEFKERFMADVNAAAESVGVPAGDIPIRAVENTPDVHNVIVCTLCSCYPRGLLGVPPDWYKSRAYRSRTVREPRAVLSEFGTDLPDDLEVRVHDSTADLRYIVLPMRPEGTESMDEAALEALVSRDCMIGVSLPRNPKA